MSGSRFQFGKNWEQYAGTLTPEMIAKATASFQSFTHRARLDGERFLDIGCGSGLHSLVAQHLGAKEILSFDFDAISVKTTQTLKNQTEPDSKAWKIEQGDVLNLSYITSLGTFDYVYSWGVLHHTGKMWKAIENALLPVRPGGILHLALYNKHWTSPFWWWIKRVYCASPSLVQKALLKMYVAADYLRVWIRHRENPKQMIERYTQNRGMMWYYNLHDWLGGYPYEYASVDEVKNFLAPRGFECVKVDLNTGTGCSEFLFRRLEKN
jgi:2-polyprenyl-3-methyl-5-hydroxy-6-metoxy-1,4-benzoquinol methylase